MRCCLCLTKRVLKFDIFAGKFSSNTIPACCDQSVFTAHLDDLLRHRLGRPTDASIWFFHPIKLIRTFLWVLSEHAVRDDEPELGEASSVPP